MGKKWALTNSAASRSNCCGSCTQERLTRSSDSPSGTLGGRMPGTKKPASRSFAAARRVLSGEPKMTGTIWLSERPMFSPPADNFSRNNFARARSSLRRWGSDFTTASAANPAAAIASGMAVRHAMGLAFASDTISIAVMELVDNAVVLLIPGAMLAGLDSVLFWVSLAVALAIAWIVAFPVNRWLIARGRGHAVIHGAH